MTPGLETFVHSAIRNCEAALAAAKDREQAKNDKTCAALTALDTATDHRCAHHDR